MMLSATQSGCRALGKRTHNVPKPCRVYSAVYVYLLGYILAIIFVSHAEASLRVPTVETSNPGACAATEQQYWTAAEAEISRRLSPYDDFVRTLKSEIEKLDSERTWYHLNPAGEYACSIGRATAIISEVADSLDSKLLEVHLLRVKHPLVQDMAARFVAIYDAATCALKLGIGGVANDGVPVEDVVRNTTKVCTEKYDERIAEILAEEVKDVPIPEEFRDGVCRGPDGKQVDVCGLVDIVIGVGTTLKKAHEAGSRVDQDCRSYKATVAEQKSRMVAEIRRTEDGIRVKAAELRDKFSGAYYEQCQCEADRQRWIAKQEQISNTQKQLLQMWARPEVRARYAADRGPKCVHAMDEALLCLPEARPLLASCDVLRQNKGNLGNDCESMILDAGDSCRAPRDGVLP